MKNIIIIGGGVSGLSAGIYALKNGYNPLILEKNPLAGGLCTSWFRQGMELDGCIHWITGSSPSCSIYKSWQELHAIHSQDELIFLPTWGSYKFLDTTVTFYCDLNKAEEEWNKISPIDKKAIHHFFKMVKKIRDVDLPLDAPAALLPLKTKMLFVRDLFKAFPYLMKSMNMSCEKYAKRFKHPALRWAIIHAQPGAGNLYSMVYSYATVASKNGGILKGGSKKFISNMLEYYLDLGGAIKYNAEVVDVNVDKKKKECTGLVLKNGEVISGDYYVSCCDANYVLINLLKNKFVHSKLAERYNKPHYHPAPSCVLINFKVPADVNINNPTNFLIDGFRLANKVIDHINMRSFNYDEHFIKNGYTNLQVLLDQDSLDYPFWVELRKNNEKYQEYKRNIAEIVKNLIENEIPEYKDKMTLLDVSTPMTFVRYTNASRGSYMSFLFNHRKGVLTTRGHLAGIKNFMLSGQYVQTPGGLPLAMASGKFSIQWIKHEECSFFFRFLNLFKV